MCTWDGMLIHDVVHETAEVCIKTANPASLFSRSHFLRWSFEHDYMLSAVDNILSIQLELVEVTSILLARQNVLTTVHTKLISLSGKVADVGRTNSSRLYFESYSVGVVKWFTQFVKVFLCKCIFYQFMEVFCHKRNSLTWYTSNHIFNICR